MKQPKTKQLGRHSPSAGKTGPSWTRAAEDLDAGLLFGRRLKELREAQNLSLAKVTARTGIPAATLSRIENNKMAPTLGVLLKIMNAFELEWSDIVSPATNRSASIPPNISTKDAGGAVAVKTGRYIFPHGDAKDFPLFPIVLELSATKPEAFGGLVGHNGFEFCYVLEGELTFHMQEGDPIRLKAGQSILFDSVQPHAYTTGRKGPSRLLIVLTKPQGSSFNTPDSELGQVRDRRLRS